MSPICFPLLFLLCTFPGTSNNEVNAYVSGMAELKCLFQNLENYSVNDLIYTWEKKKINTLSDVVAELYEGKIKTEHVSDSFKNRTLKIIPNGDLQMFDITLEDQGIYLCFVRKRTHIIRMLYDEKCKLNVMANFTVPEIKNESLLAVEKNSEVTIYCSSSDGYPKPREVLWTVSYENRTEHYQKDCNLERGPLCSVTNNSKTFNIYSQLTLTVMTNISVNCTVVAHHNVSSNTVHIGVKDEAPSNPPDKGNGNMKYILTSVILLIISIIAAICYWIKGKKSRSRSLQNGAGTLGTVAIPVLDTGTQQPDENTSFIDRSAEANGS